MSFKKKKRKEKKKGKKLSKLWPGAQSAEERQQIGEAQGKLSAGPLSLDIGSGVWGDVEL